MPKMADYKKETDKVHKITLSSKISQALWDSKIAGIGEKVNFDVWTLFVGNGSEIQIKVEDKSGKTIEKITGQVYGNYFAGSIIIPEKAKDELSFTAKLPKHSLEKKSEALRVIPQRSITNAKWGQQEARRGDIVKLSAETKNIPDETEVMIKIFEHDQDGAHDFVTKFPAKVKNNKIEAEWEYEYHDDVDDIPTDDEMKKVGRKYSHPEYFFIVRSGRAEGKSGLLKFKDWIEIELSDDNGNPIPNEDYILTFSDGSERRGKLDKNGKTKVEDLPPGKVSVKYPNLGITS